MFQQLSGSSEDVVGFKIGDPVTGEDVREMGRIMADAIALSGRIRLLVEIEGFPRMEPTALLEKLKFAKDHAGDIEKMAVVCDRAWIRLWLKIGGLLTHRDAEHFNRSEMESAWQWIRE